MAKSAVEGLDEFRMHMAGHEQSYALIGGVACDIILSDAELPFRATRDLDTVLIANASMPEAAKALWRLIKDGGYRCGWRENGEARFYRFTEPVEKGYPTTIELFSKTPDFLEEGIDVSVAPLHIDDDISSLSAILLDENYYDFLTQGTTVLDGISILDAAHIIPFKAKAFLDLAKRKSDGEPIDSKKVKKHKRDVFRLVQVLPPSMRVQLPASILEDMRAFVEEAERAPLDLKQLGIQLSYGESIAALKSIYDID